MSDDAKPQFNRAIRGLRCDVRRLEYGWTLGFGGNAVLMIHTQWRIVREGRIVFASSDDGQNFGSPEPIDGEAKSNQLLDGRRVASVEVALDTADICLRFDDGTRLDIFNHSSGYEGWHACFGTCDQNVEIIATGGGDLAILRLPIRKLPKS
jgi:hypothetical protein